MARDTNMVILVPHTDASRFSAMVSQQAFSPWLALDKYSKKIDVRVTYSTSTQPTVARTLRKSSIVNVSLPIAVNVEDFFRGKRCLPRLIHLVPFQIKKPRSQAIFKIYDICHYPTTCSVIFG